MSWTFSKSIAKSKIVQSSFIWLIIAPLFAKAMSNLDEKLTIQLFNQNFQINTTLPFSWEFLFYAATAFTIGNIVFQIWCPALVKRFYNYKDYSDSGNSLLATHYQVKTMKYDALKQKLKNDHKDLALGYAKRYLSERITKDEDFPEHRFDSTQGSANFETKSEAFYLALRIGDLHNRTASIVAATFYVIGLAFIITIFCENFLYVINSSSTLN